ncbi:MAG: hypothetical protein NC819_02025 [Candidatus Omnitrophica bacterium]|nr:hypothetical protein [Candidatus Omnitrophota bacterium]
MRIIPVFTLGLLFQFITPVLPLQAQEPVQSAAERPVKGMWVWHFQTYSTAAERQRLLDFCREEGITLLLVQVHYALDPVTGVPTGMRDPQAYGDLIEQAKRASITVEALEGDPKWPLPEWEKTWWPKFNVIMDWYNRQPPQRRFSGLHLDVEPYLLPDFDTREKWNILWLYVDFMDRVRKELRRRGPELVFAADIPFWYDNFPKADEFLNHNVIEFNGAEKPASHHIQDICDYIGIMSYRQHATGPNSITRLCEEELAYAEKIGKKIFCGVEMSPDQDPPSISFYGTSVELFREQTDLVYRTFGRRRGFGGLLIHYYNTYSAFLGKPLPEMTDG